MTNEDKKLVAGYMGWRTRTHTAHVFNMHEDFVFTTCDNGLRNIYFDLNDAGLCTKEMKRRRDWADFVTHVEADTSKRFNTWSQLLAWLYDSDNFFTAMAKWLREAEK
jgi:hypothetical protein